MTLNDSISPMETKNLEQPCDNTEDLGIVYKFRELRGDQEVTHGIRLLRETGYNSAGVHVAQAVQSECQVNSLLFYGGKPFVLRVYNI